MKVLVNGQSYEVSVHELTRERATFEIGGRRFQVEAERDVPVRNGSTVSTTRRTHSKKIQIAEGQAAVTAPIPGLVIEISVSPGESVTEGQLLGKLEAMKMQNSIIAPCSGKIEQITIAVGDEVNDGQLLFAIRV